MAASLFHPVQIHPQNKRHDQKTKGKVSLVQIYVKIPQSPVLVCCISDKGSVFLQYLNQISCSQMLPQKLKKGQRAAEKEKYNCQCSCFSASCHTPGNTVKHHKKSQKRKNAYRVVGNIKPKPQKLQIAHKKLKHKMVFYILPSKMGILGGKIILKRKRPHHCRMGRVISEHGKS